MHKDHSIQIQRNFSKLKNYNKFQNYQLTST